MKTSNLRVGNFIKSTSFDVSRVVSIDANGNVEFVHYAIPDSEIGVWQDGEITPIRITEEWLLMFGFNKFGNLNQTYFLNHDLETSFSFGNYAHAQTDRRSKPNLIIEGRIICPDNGNLKYVHQLQNLYFAIKGTELTLKS